MRVRGGMKKCPMSGMKKCPIDDHTAISPWLRIISRGQKESWHGPEETDP